MPYGFTDAQWAAMPAPEKEAYVTAEAKKKKAQTGTTVTPVKATTITPGVTTPKTPVTTTPTTQTTTDPDQKLASDYASGKISKAELDAGMQKLRSVSATPAAQTGTQTGATATIDPIIQQYKNAYATAQAAGNTLGMLNAAEGADKRRVELGQAPINAAQIQRLTNQLTPEQKLERASGSMMNKQNELANFSQNYKPETSEQDYMSQISSYIDSLLKQQQNETEAANKKARSGILTDAEISKRELDDAYAAQLAELSSQADAIRNAYSSSKRNVETQNVDTMNNLTAQADKIVQLYEQNKSQLGIDKQDLIDDLAASAENIRNAYASGARNLESQNTETLDELAAQTDKIMSLFEQSKNRLSTDKQSQMDDILFSIDQIKNAYTTAKTGIEAQKAETLPTYDTAMNQQDVLAQREKKAVEADFAQRGLGAGGQVVSELGQLGQENLSQIGKITGQKQAYERDVSNQLSGLEREQATGLASAERNKMQVEQDYANAINEIESNKTLSLSDVERLKAQATKDYQNALADLEQGQATGLADVEREKAQAERQYAAKLSEIESNKALSSAEVEQLKAQATRDYQNSLADLEQSQTTALADVARAGSTAAQSLSSGKMSIIQKVNNALNNLTTDEQSTLADLAEQRAQMLYEAKQTYSEQSTEERNTAFNQLLAEAGVAADSVDAIRSLIDDYNEAEMAALEYKIKELELQGLSETQKLEIAQLKQDYELGKITAKKVESEIALQWEKFEFEKERAEKEEEEEENYTKNEMTASLEGKLDSLSTPEKKLAYIKSIKSDIITYLGKSAYEAYLEEYGG